MTAVPVTTLGAGFLSCRSARLSPKHDWTITNLHAPKLNVFVIIYERPSSASLSAGPCLLQPYRALCATAASLSSSVPVCRHNCPAFGEFSLSAVSIDTLSSSVPGKSLVLVPGSVSQDNSLRQTSAVSPSSHPRPSRRLSGLRRSFAACSSASVPRLPPSGRSSLEFGYAPADAEGVRRV